MARRIACVDGLESARYRLLSWHASETQTAQFCQQVAHGIRVAFVCQTMLYGLKCGYT